MDLMCFFGVIVEELVAMTDRDGVMVEPLRSTTARDCLFGGVLRTRAMDCFLGDFKTKVLRCFFGEDAETERLM